MSAHPRPAVPARHADYAGHDALLTDLADYGPSLRSGLFNHTPMVVEALCALGVPEHARPWFEGQRSTLSPRPAGPAPVSETDWRSALGRPERFADLSERIRGELNGLPWQQVLDTWSARLAPGLATAACHGVIRTGHAARALADAATAARRNELADGLAAWAAMYETLPVASVTHRGSRQPRAVLRELDGVPAARRPPPGLITTGLLSLRHAPRFAEQAGAAAIAAGDVDALIALFAEVFCASANDAFTAIVFTHAVTACAAVGNLLPHVRPTTGQMLAERAWEAGCALQAAFGVPLPASPPAPATVGPDALIDAAVANGDDHVIKLTEACVGAYRRGVGPAPLAAAVRVQRLLG